MQRKTERKVLAYCNKHRMLEHGDSVVLGVSGGADSVCLLFVLLALRDELDLKLHVVHVNHGIRPDAGEDADYVKKLCRENNLPFYLVECHIPTEAAKLGCSEEEAGRKVRYAAFKEVCKEEQCTKIAVAHNSNDRAETMLFHLFRGTGLTGLAGIRPVRENIIRPILCLERSEIEEYLNFHQIPYRHDSTNDSDDYTRNKIRHHILPYAQEEIVNGCVANMTRSADILAETENYIEEQVKKAWDSCVTAYNQEETFYHIDRQLFLKEHSLIQKRLLLELLKELSPMHKDITAVHVEDVLSLFIEAGNRSMDLPYDMHAYRQYEEVVLERKKAVCEKSHQWEAVSIKPEDISEEEQVISLGKGRKVLLRLINAEKEGINCKDIPQNQYTKWFDYDKINECLMLRTRRGGDFLCIHGKEALQHKKLKDYMITEKIPKKRREELPLLAEGSHVLWLVGYRISEYYKVNTDTQRILQVTYRQNSRVTESDR